MSDDTEAATDGQAPGAPAAGETAQAQQQQAAEAAGESEQQATAETEGEGEGEGASDEPRRRESGTRRLKRQRDALASENAELHRRLHEIGQRGGADADPEPQEKDFSGDRRRYEQAHNAWTIRRAVSGEFRRRDEAESAGRRHAAARELAEAYAERLDEARERIADFDATVQAMSGRQVNDPLFDSIMASEKGPLIAYHLAKHPQRFAELNALGGTPLAIEIARLEGSVRMPSGNRQTGANAPPSSVKGGAAQAPSLQGKSPEEYRKLRESGVT